MIDLFDFDKYGQQGQVDYILGAKEHRSGVYVVGKCENEIQRHYLDYYKVTNKHPYYVFLRPYHLCTRSSAAAAVRLIMVLSPTETIASTFDTFRHLV